MRYGFSIILGQNQLLFSGSIGGRYVWDKFKDPWILNDHISFSVNIMIYIKIDF